MVAVGVEIRGAGSGRLRMKAIDDASSATLFTFVINAVAEGARVHTDAWQGYGKLNEPGYEHHPLNQAAARAAGQDPGEMLPCAPGHLQPQHLVGRHPPFRFRRTSADLPGRVCLPVQSPPHTHGRLPDTPWPGYQRTADHLQPDIRGRTSATLAKLS